MKQNDSINDCEIHIPGYKMFRLNEHGGGVCFYRRNSINFSNARI